MSGNLFAALPERLPGELFEILAETAEGTVERIVSTGQATPEGEWLCQDRHEWVVLLKGAADLFFEGENTPSRLVPGDYINIPAGTRHRVDWTADDEPTVWLAIHYR